MHKKSLIFVFAVIFLIIVGGFFLFQKDVQKEGSGDGLQVVTTFTPLYIFTKNITHEIADVQNLLPSGVGPHDYSFTPSDVVKLSNADVVVKQGRGLDDWVNDAIKAAGRNDILVIDASKGIEPHTGPTGITLDNGLISENPHGPLVKPTPEDPHIWIDPFLAIGEVENIRNGLMSIDEENAVNYAKNAEEYLLKLLMLDEEIRNVLDDLSNRDFVTFHPAFRYFAYEYGLREVAVIEDVPGKEITPGDLMKLVNSVKSAAVSVIFSEPQFSPRIVETLANDYGLRIVELDPLETGELDPSYYELVTRNNVQAIVDSFK